MTSTEYNRKWRAANPEKCAAYTKKYIAANLEKVKARRRAWVEKNKPRVVERIKRWAKQNPDKINAASKRWRTRHPQKQQTVARAWRLRNLSVINRKERDRCATNLSYRLARRLRNRLYQAISQQFAKKNHRTMDLTGCNIDFLEAHLESLFKLGMSWENYGSVWEIDHRIPCASFDLTNEVEQRRCFHFSNLQPLFVTENRRKYAKLIGNKL